MYEPARGATGQHLPGRSVVLLYSASWRPWAFALETTVAQKQGDPGLVKPISRILG
jgi:hypothetical protein